MMPKIPISTFMGLYFVIIAPIGGVLLKGSYMFYILLLIGVTYVFYLWFISRPLPGESYYNPFGFIELHIGSGAKKNKFKFYKLCYKTINVAKEQNKDVLFYTWHVSRKKLAILFGEAITIYKPSIIDRINLFPCIVMGVMPFRFPNPYIKCYISIDKLKNHQLENK